MPRHYPAGRAVAPSASCMRRRAVPALLLAALLLGLVGCASIDEPPAVAGPGGSEPRPLRSPRTDPAVALDLRADDLLMRAVGLIGTPYRFGGSTPEQGFDCSGFTAYVYREALGLQLPRTAHEQFHGPASPVAKDELATGDLVFFRQGRGRIDHVGIYVGEGRFIHAPSRGGRVRIDVLAAPHWAWIYEGARRPLVESP